MAVLEVAFVKINKRFSIIGYPQTIFGAASLGKDKSARASYSKMSEV